MKYLTREELQGLLVRIDNKRDRLLIQLGLVLGCRVSEIVNIRCKNISGGCIKLWDEKKDCYRETVVDQQTEETLQDFLATDWNAKPHTPHRLFYFSTKTANRILKKWCRAANIPSEKSHWHALRHTYVVQSLEAGVPLNHVCEQTGDSPNTVIKVYGRPSIDARREMLERKAYWRG
jgi:integrase